MTEIVLGGYSLKNKDWALEVQNKLPSHPQVIEWPHWISDRNSFSVQVEADKLVDKLNGLHVNVIAKSVGTLVLMLATARLKDSLGKIIICGLPLNDLTDEDKEAYKVLKNYPVEKMLFIQNDSDNHGSALEVQAFLMAINPDIELVIKTRADHEYPYFEDFGQFLKV